MKKFPTILDAAVREFLASDAKRTYERRDDGALFLLDVDEVIDEDGRRLVVKTWGFDNEEIPLPATAEAARRLRRSNLLDMIVSGPVKQVANNLYADICRRAG